MNPRRLVLLGTLALALTALPWLAGQETEARPRSTHTSAKELRWGETPFGPEISSLEGNMTEGAHITYFRFPAGMKTPLHTHEEDYVGIVISGTSRHWTPGKPETQKDLPPGSHWSMPAGQEHISECLPGMECVMAVVQKGAFDMKMIKAER